MYDETSGKSGLIFFKENIVPEGKYEYFDEYTFIRMVSHYETTFKAAGLKIVD